MADIDRVVKTEKTAPTLRAAVASGDGKVINRHFGGAEKFIIVDITPDSYAVVETREVERVCGGGAHHDDGLYRVAESLADCQLLLVLKIGPGAKSVVERFGIEVIENGGIITETIEKLQTSPYILRRYLADAGGQQ
jgi:predicted Fe-Mo cluster-binding NifX family protein